MQFSEKDFLNFLIDRCYCCKKEFNPETDKIVEFENITTGKIFFVHEECFHKMLFSIFGKEEENGKDKK